MAFNIKQNDTSPSLQATLKDASGTAIALTGASVRFHMKALDGTVKVDAAMAITNASGGVVQYNWQTGDTNTVGSYSVEFEVTYSDSTIETFPNNQNLTISVVRELS